VNEGCRMCLTMLPVYDCAQMLFVERSMLFKQAN
jgi:hypothetical protein